MTDIKYSVIIPVYNRPDEVSELLESLSRQTRTDFEVIIVEDGSSVRCDHVAEKYKPYVRLTYYFKKNEGPGPARNFGYALASGKYLVCFDSDCVIPPKYFDAVDQALQVQHLDAWGGADRAHENFTWLQRATGYTMSSFFTTGGIRGGRKRIGWFQPRSFNMGISREVYQKLGGFRFSRYAEDIEFSIRMKQAGFRTGLVEQAFVYHKRRTNFIQFFRQVFNFGRGRVLVGREYPGEIKLTHWFPLAFTGALPMLLLLFFISPTLFVTGAILLGLYLALIFVDALIVNRHLVVALLAVPSAIVQLTGYGLGFLKEKLKSYPS
ncbi:MAG TPA: glycosyltransferase [Chryseosolibacter sp.]|nr:glycosyltransferase [Chryseosolibacter sp.]